MENASLPVHQISQTTRKKIHISEFKTSNLDEKDLVDRLQELSQSKPEYGTFSASSGWFEVNPELYKQNRKIALRNEFLKKSILAIFISAIGYMILGIFENLPLILELLAFMLIVVGVSFFIYRVLMLLVKRETEDKTVRAGVISLIGGSFM